LLFLSVSLPFCSILFISKLSSLQVCNSMYSVGFHCITCSFMNVWEMCILWPSTIRTKGKKKILSENHPKPNINNNWEQGYLLFVNSKVFLYNNLETSCENEHFIHVIQNDEQISEVT
jgi:hypothetical protein